MPRTFSTRSTRIVVTLLFLVAFVSALWPVGVNLHSDWVQSRAASSYARAVDKNEFQAVAEPAVNSAHAWNDAHAKGPILDPWLSRIDKDNVGYQDYLQQLRVPGAASMGQLLIPGISVNLPIYHGSSADVLTKGVGHLYGSSLPVGGPGTHAVLTGHTGLGSATLFDHLSDVKQGDKFYIHVAGKYLGYKVSDIRVVLPNDAKSLAPVEGKDLVTLVTCTPYGINDHRLLVTGERIPDEDPAVIEGLTHSSTEWHPKFSGWMLGYSLLGLAILLCWIWVVPVQAFRARRGANDDQ